MASSKTLVHKMLKNPIILSKLATDGPRLVPQRELKYFFIYSMI